MIHENRILIVDDDAGSLRLLERVLRNRYRIESASSGQAALDALPRFRPDLILLDINMPYMDGYETCRRIRSDDTYKLTKILLVSGHSNLDERLRGYEVGADDYVTKPFDNSELRAKIDVFMKLKRAEEVDAIKDDLLALFSHETRTPLSGIMGMAELIADDEEASEQIREQARLIHRNSVHLLRFIEKATLLRTLKSGFTLTPREAPLHRHLEQAIQTVDAKAHAKGVKIVMECQKDIHLNADWSIVDEAFAYLADNAVKFSPDNGTVTVKASIDGSDCVVSVTDLGPGIVPEAQNHIFEAFCIRDIAHHHEGQGLSLAIAKHAVEYHSGDIGVTSEPGKGATFTVRLPCAGCGGSRGHRGIASPVLF